MALTVAPWTIRNAVVMDGFIPVANNAELDALVGAQPRRQRLDREPRGLAAAHGCVAGLRDRAGEQLRREAISWAVHNPHKELGLIPRKLLMLNQGSSG